MTQESYDSKLSPQWVKRFSENLEAGGPFTEFLDNYRKITWAVEQLEAAGRDFEIEEFGLYLTLFKIHGTV